VLDKEKYWGEQFLRDNQEVRSTNYPDLSLEEKKQLEESWRYKVKNIIDVQYYYDWDLLEEYREDLSQYYKKTNAGLKKLLPSIEIPEIYNE